MSGRVKAIGCSRLIRFLRSLSAAHSAVLFSDYFGAERWLERSRKHHELTKICPVCQNR